MNELIQINQNTSHMTTKEKLTTRRANITRETCALLRQLPRLDFTLIIALALSLSSPMARAVSPPPDGGYGNYNTAEGDSALYSLTTGGGNTAMGNRALYSNTTGTDNTATGFDALLLNKTGSNNTANGANALIYNNGSDNTATGHFALEHNTTGTSNTAAGVSALQANTTGLANTAIGTYALTANTTGGSNTATGLSALNLNTTGSANTANGLQALQSNTTGNNNAAIGYQALLANTTGSQNTATGYAALSNNTTGNLNLADGLNALLSNTIGSFNTGQGVSALYNNTTGSNNTASGYNALVGNTTGNSNIALGNFAGSSLTTGSNNIDIGNGGVAGESNKIRIGTKGTQTATFIAGISGVAVTGSQVVVGPNGKLGVAASSARFKEAIKPMDKTSEAILALHPVSFRYKHDVDPDAIPQFGLVAEQVAKVNPDLVARDDQGKPYTVRYEAVNAMLLNEFLKEHRVVRELQATVARQQSTNAEQQKEIAALTTALKEQAGQIEKVNAQLQLNATAPRLVTNN